MVNYEEVPEETLHDLQIKLEKIKAYIRKSEMKLEKYEKELERLRKVMQEKQLKKLLSVNKELPKIDHKEI